MSKNGPGAIAPWRGEIRRPLRRPPSLTTPPPCHRPPFLSIPIIYTCTVKTGPAGSRRRAGGQIGPAVLFALRKTRHRVPLGAGSGEGKGLRPSVLDPSTRRPAKRSVWTARGLPPLSPANGTTSAKIIRSNRLLLSRPPSRRPPPLTPLIKIVCLFSGYELRHHHLQRSSHRTG